VNINPTIVMESFAVVRCT